MKAALQTGVPSNYKRYRMGHQENKPMRFENATLAMLLLAVVSAVPVWSQDPTGEPRWLPATPEKLPRWRGFNLLENFMLPSGRKPFVEEDFRLIAKLGFNFVRLPMDYRFWIKDGNWEEFDEATLQEIDQAVQWGGQYGIHVSLNFHRAPGYTVAQPPEKTSLWNDPERNGSARSIGPCSPGAIRASRVSG